MAAVAGRHPDARWQPRSAPGPPHRSVRPPLSAPPPRPPKARPAHPPPLSRSAARTLLYYYYELNPTSFGWFSNYLKENKIPRDGNWDDVSGETFLRTLLSMPMEEVSWGKSQGFDSMYDCTGGLLVNPRDVAQRVMEIRTQIAKEWIEELKGVSEENALLMRESVLSSFSALTVAETGDGGDGARHPEMRPEPEVDDSAAGIDD